MPRWISEDDWTRIAADAELLRVEAGTPIVRQGDRGRGLVVLATGFARVERADGASGFAIARLGPGDAIGEMSLLEDTAASATVVADDDVTALAIGRDVLARLLDADAAFAARVYRGLAVSLSARLRMTTAQAARLGASDVSQAPRQRDVLTGHVADRHVPDALVYAVAEFRAQLWSVEEAMLLRRGGADGHAATVARACDALLDALAEQVSDAALTETGYEDLLSFRDPERLATGLGAYVFREAFPAFMASATMARCHARAHGYAGDAVTIERLLTASAEGDGALGRFVDAWFLARPYGVARRELRQRMSDRLRHELKRATPETSTRVLALTARAPLELVDAFAPATNTVKITALDGDHAALRHAAGLVAHGGLAGITSFAHVNAARLAQGDGELPLAPQSLVYGLGSTDGMTDDEVAGVIDWAHGALAPGGTLVLANALPQHADRLLFEHVLEWHAHEREPDQWTALVRSSHFGAEATLHVETVGDVFAWVEVTRVD